jgi:transcription elongation GreA/GreB family factor
MSRAFVSEEAEESRAAAVPERPVSTHPNLVTPTGLVLIETALASAQSALAKAPADDTTRPRLQRDLRYWQARRATATPVQAHTSSPDEVVFGVLVTVRRGKTTSRFRIVGEDEADPAQGLLSYLAPLAAAVLGAETGETVEIEGREPVQVLAIDV